jgi:hypothetical protein
LPLPSSLFLYHSSFYNNNNYNKLFFRKLFLFNRSFSSSRTLSDINNNINNNNNNNINFNNNNIHLPVLYENGNSNAIKKSLIIIN